MIKLFEDFNEYNEIKEWLDEFKIQNYTINDDLTVDVNGQVDLNGADITGFGVQFRNINGYFSCEDNFITSLEGGPIHVSGDFYCEDNRLESLEYAPKYVGGEFYCNYNELTSLKGCPEMINDNFRCDNNKLTSLEYCPKSINGYLYCSNNKLTTLEYFPEYLRDEFIYDDNDELPEELQSLDYKLIKTLSKHQLQYGIWNSDNSLNKKRWNIFYNDYMNDNLS